MNCWLLLKKKLNEIVETFPIEEIAEIFGIEEDFTEEEKNEALAAYYLSI